ncbi:MAG: energy-converting hydrogenase B subunit J [Methanobacteriaceae archaeon]
MIFDGIVWGPIIVGLIIGFIIGTRIQNKGDVIKFRISSIIVLIILFILVAWQLGQYPYYNDLPLATVFVSSGLGLLIGRYTLGSSLKSND